MATKSVSNYPFIGQLKDCFSVILETLKTPTFLSKRRNLKSSGMKVACNTGKLFSNEDHRWGPPARLAISFNRLR